MANAVTLIYSVEFSATSTILVTHNNGGAYVGIQLLIGGAVRSDLIARVDPDPTDPNNALTVYLTSPQTGVLQIFQAGMYWGLMSTVKEKLGAKQNYGPCRVATTSNVAALAGGAPDTVDGVSLGVGDRVLVKDQSTSSQNGIYVVTTVGTGADGTWARAMDADESATIVPASTVSISEGTANSNTQWILTTPAPIILDTTSLTYTGTSFPSFPAISAYDSAGSQSFTGTITVNLDATSVEDASFTLSANTVTIAFTGRIEISGAVSLKTLSGGRSQADAWIEQNGVEIPGTRVTMYCRQSAMGGSGTMHRLLPVTNGDVFRLRAQRVEGSGTLSPAINGSRLLLKKLS